MPVALQCEQAALADAAPGAAKSAADALRSGVGKARAHVRDQFNWKQHFAAELRLIEAEKAGLATKANPQRGSRFAVPDAQRPMVKAWEAEDVALYAHHERPLSSSSYSVLFRADLKPGVHYPGNRDIVHFQEANMQLHNKMKIDPVFASQDDNIPHHVIPNLNNRIICIILKKPLKT